MKDYTQKFNKLFNVPMLLLQLINLIFSAALPKDIAIKSDYLFMDIQQKISTCSHVSYNILIWIVALKLQQDVIKIFFSFKFCHFVNFISFIYSYYLNQIQSTMRAWLHTFHYQQFNFKGQSWQQAVMSLEEKIQVVSFTGEVETDVLEVSAKFFTMSYSTFSSVSILSKALHILNKKSLKINYLSFSPR